MLRMMKTTTYRHQSGEINKGIYGGGIWGPNLIRYAYPSRAANRLDMRMHLASEAESVLLTLKFTSRALGTITNLQHWPLTNESKAWQESLTAWQSWKWSVMLTVPHQAPGEHVERQNPTSGSGQSEPLYQRGWAETDSR